MLIKYKVLAAHTKRSLEFPTLERSLKKTKLECPEYRPNEVGALENILNKVSSSFGLYPLQPSEEGQLIIDKLNALLCEQDNVVHAYVDHGATHSDRVAEIAMQILFAASELPSFRMLCFIYPKQVIELSVKVAAWAHDTGYIKQSELGLEKAVHALFSAENFHVQIKDLLYKFFMGISTELDDERATSICNGIEKAIFHHNGDNKECAFTHKLEGAYGTVLTNDPNMPDAKALAEPCYGRVTDYRRANDRKIGLPYKEYKLNDSIESVIGSILRTADNLDMLHNRLTIDQSIVIERTLQELSSEYRDDTKFLEEIPLPKITYDNDDQKKFYGLLEEDLYQRKFFFGLYIGRDRQFQFNDAQFTITIRNKHTLHLTVIDEKGRPVSLQRFFSERAQTSLEPTCLFGKPIKFELAD